MIKTKKKQYAIEMKDITMTFGNFKALDGVELLVEKGEVHALIGENGAGKSTLMAVLFGMYKPTKGTIKINGKFSKIDTPLVANEMGIGMVHQHFMLIDTFTALENIVLNSEKTNLGFINMKEAREKIELIMNKFNFKVDLDKVTGNASVAEQQRIEILKMLYKDADILIFDEPTAVLTPKQITEFLKAIKDLQKKGKTIIIISHKLDELKEVATNGTIIRRGKFIDRINVKKATVQAVAKKMVGTSIKGVKNKYVKPLSDEPVVVIDNLSVNIAKTKVIGLKDFSLDIKPGEIVAIAGVEGNGQSQLINGITGMQKVVSGSVTLNGEDITNQSILNRYKKGMAHIPEDRHKHGSVLDMSQVENLIIQDHRNKEFSKLGVLKMKQALIATEAVEKNFDVRSSNGVKSKLRSMSGGNQQKFIVGRELAKESNKFIVIAQPTRGLDVGAITNIHEYILSAKKDGNAILLVSYELDEVLSLADRIAVLNAGSIVDVVNAKGITKTKLGELMAGKATKKKRTIKKVASKIAAKLKGGK